MDKIRKGDAENPRKDFAALAAASEKKIRYIFLTGGYLSLFFRPHGAKCSTAQGKRPGQAKGDRVHLRTLRAPVPDF